MILTTLTDLFIRDLNRVRSEINLYRQEANIWAVPPGINNSAGNLSLHLVGNLNTYIGAELGQTGYIRHRDLEFSRRDVPRTELIQQLDQTIEVIERTLANVDPARLADEYPLLVLGEKTSTEYFLVHLATHLSYHLGQINYHRRLVEGV